jgi:hypothetical protein
MMMTSLAISFPADNSRIVCSSSPCAINESQGYGRRTESGNRAASCREPGVAKTSTWAAVPEGSEKGALSVYGLGRFPVTLYREQWEKLLAGEIRTFIHENDQVLKKKE